MNRNLGYIQWEVQNEANGDKLLKDAREEKEEHTGEDSDVENSNSLGNLFQINEEEEQEDNTVKEPVDYL